MTDLASLTVQAFAPDGPLAEVFARQGRRYAFNAEQVAYATAVATALEGPGQGGFPPVALLEAETGTGKTLGYLVPLMLAVARGRRGIVSTYTVQLMRQVGDVEAPVAAEVVRRLTGARIRVAALCGLRNYVAAKRVAARRAELQAEGAPVTVLDRLDELSAWAEDAAAGRNSGLLADYVEAFGPLPIDEAGVGLSAADGAEDRAAYERAREEAADADVVVMPHALLLLHALRRFSAIGGAGDERPPVAVLDEADAVAKAAASLYRTALPLKDLERAVARVRDAGIDCRHLAGAVQRAMERMEALFGRHADDPDILTRFGSAGGVLVLAGAGARYRLEFGVMAEEIARLARRVVERAGGRRGLAPALDELALACHAAEEIARDCRGEAGVGARAAAALAWSPVRSFPAMALFPVRPGRLAMRLWTPRETEDGAKRSYFGAVVLTSATLDVPGPDAERREEFRALRTELGVPENPPCRRFAPADFGRARFVLTDVSVPKPTVGESEDDGARSNPLWLDHAAGLIATASGEGGRTLVLTTSFLDTAALAERLRHRGLEPIEHRRGEKLAGCLGAFRDDPRAILLTPAGWEGLDLPGLVRHLAIPRLPFPPPDAVHNVVLEKHYRALGLGERDIRLKMASAVTMQARRRMRQGFGRGIRRAEDDVVFWIGDPRFPTPRAAKLVVGEQEGDEDRARPIASFVYTVPARFRKGLRPAYQKAKIVGSTRGGLPLDTSAGARGSVRPTRRPEASAKRSPRRARRGGRP